MTYVSLTKLIISPLAFYCLFQGVKKNLYELGASVDLSYNKMTELPDAAVKGLRLKQLDVRGNQITIIPDNIHLVFTLTSLNLSHNLLEDLPREIGFLK